MRVQIIQMQQSFEVSFIYGQNSYTQRRDLWTSLQHLSSTMSSTPWTVLGDFNVVRRPTDRQGGDQSWPSYLDDLNNCCRDSSLEDLRYSGCHLTWNKGTGDNALMKKLDRALTNHVWLTEFTESEALFLNKGASDHSPIVVDTGVMLHTRKPPFHFFNFWAEHDSFEDLVCNAWAEQIWGSPQYSLCKKLKRLKGSLKAFNRECFSNIHSRSSLARENLSRIQKSLQSFPGNHNLLLQERHALQDLIKYSAAEESLTRQKSRMLWIREGDQNTNFFHQCLKNRHNQNKIISLSLDENTRIYHPLEIQEAVVTHFQSLFSKPSDSGTGVTDLSFFVSKSIS